MELELRNGGIPVIANGNAITVTGNAITATGNGSVLHHLVVNRKPVLPLDLISSNAPEPLTPHDQRRRAALLADSPGTV